ncbi:MAG: hypothetical protein AAFX01_12680 [Cyanobacteria bacterium J06638_28]
MAKLSVYALGVAAALTASVAIAVPGVAQDAPTSESGDIPTAVDEIFFGNTGPYQLNRTRWKQLDFMTGLGGFTELDTARDAEAISRAAHYLLDLQSTIDPTIRVPDLFNPYTTSIQLMPATTQTSGRVSGSEFIFETAPFITP